MVELQLPMPPSANHLWVRARKGMRKSERYVAWLMLAAIEARKQSFQRVSGPYKLSMCVSRPNKRRADIDNKIKPVSDLLAHLGVIEDDCLCEMVTARWVTTGQGVHVRIEPAGVEA